MREWWITIGLTTPIFDLLDNDRVTPFPTGVWDQVAKVRHAVLDTIATLSAPGIGGC